MTETDPDSTSKLTKTKTAWAQEGRFLTGRTRPASERLPPGQHLVKNWPVLDLGILPNVDRAHWRLDVGGAAAQPLSIDFEQFRALAQSRFVTDIHCVTTWSRYDNAWEGVSTRTLLDIVAPTPRAAFVELESYDGYTTNVPLADFAAPDAILATDWEGAPLTPEHGGPVRLVIPHLYFWKSAKWLRRIEFLEADRHGFWEVRGYHERGDPWKEERYSS